MLGTKLFRLQYLSPVYGNCQVFKSATSCNVSWTLTVSQKHHVHRQCVSSSRSVPKCNTYISSTCSSGRNSLLHPPPVHVQHYRYVRTFAKHPALRSEEKGDGTKVNAGNTAQSHGKSESTGATNTEASSTTTSTTSSLDPSVLSDENKEAGEQKLTVFQRFKKTYKEHGKVLVGVHLFTSSIWFGSFFYAAKLGVDVIPLMEWMGLSDKVINPFRNSSLGDVALAYLMYKLATPARYTVTLAGTNFMIRYLRKAGRMEAKKESESLRNLAKESREEVSQRTKKLKSDLNASRVHMGTKLVDNVKIRQQKLKERRDKFIASKFRRGKK